MYITVLFMGGPFDLCGGGGGAMVFLRDQTLFEPYQTQNNFFHH